MHTYTHTQVNITTHTTAENENEMLKRKIKTMAGQLETLTSALHRAQGDAADAQNKQVMHTYHTHTCVCMYVCMSRTISSHLHVPSNGPETMQRTCATRTEGIAITKTEVTRAPR
jgi:hypothetical protein